MGKDIPKKRNGRHGSWRREGLTHREIRKKVEVATSTAWLWTKDIVLSSSQKKSIEKRRKRHVWTEKEKKEKKNLACITLAPYWKKPYSKRELLTKIKEFYRENGRIPLKREFNMYREYQQRFGSWNNAIKLAGFEPNPVLFSHKFVAIDNHICDSLAEKIIDDWLFKHKINHQKNLAYGNTKMTADFATGRVRIEYFGLSGVSKLYDRTIKRKRNFCERAKLKLIEIYPSDLFSKNLSEIIRLKN